MNWRNWIEENQFDFDMSDDTFDLMKQSYIGGLQQAYDIMYANKSGDYDFVMWQLKKAIEESE